MAQGVTTKSDGMWQERQVLRAIYVLAHQQNSAIVEFAPAQLMEVLGYAQINGNDFSPTVRQRVMRALSNLFGIHVEVEMQLRSGSKRKIYGHFLDSYAVDTDRDGKIRKYAVQINVLIGESIKNLGEMPDTGGYNGSSYPHHPDRRMALMKFKVQLVVCAEDGREETVQDLTVLDKDWQRIEHLGLTLAEAQQLLAMLQQQLVAEQASTFVATRSQCDDCGATLQSKEQQTRTFRTLFGTVTLSSPRLYHCRCQRRKTTTFRPLTALLTESTAPELLFMETKWASLVSYGLTAQALKDFLPSDATLNATTVQNHTHKVAERCEAELGEEQWSFIAGCRRDWGNLPIPDGPLTVGIDGGYVRDWAEKQRQFEVSVGKSILAFTREDAEDVPSSKCLGFVQTYDQKPKRRLFEVLTSQGFQLHQQLTFLSDGGDTVRDLQLYLSPEAEHLLDGFHLAMRLTVLQQTAKGLPLTVQDEEDTYVLREAVVRELERLKWFLWHGNVYRAVQVVQSVEMDLDVAAALGDRIARKLLKAVEEFHTYIENNQGFIPNYGERYRAGERISTGFVESTVNQVVSKRFCKRQQMQWGKRGAHLLLQTRVKTLNGELGAVFKQWYPDLLLEEEPKAA
jgi:hypothetical protein